MVISIVWTVFILLEQKTNLNCIKEEHVKIKIFVMSLYPQKTQILDFNQYQKLDKALE